MIKLQNSNIIGVSEVTFFVRDVTVATWWIQDLTGLEPVFTSENFSKFRIGTTELGLHIADKKTGPGAAGSVAYWDVKDLETAIVDFLSLGGCLYRDPINAPDGGKVCQVTDLFGNVWGLREPDRS
ncbi:MAG: hypothetical protein QXN26_04750 [Thermoplasmataceae archaeon]